MTRRARPEATIRGVNLQAFATASSVAIALPPSTNNLFMTVRGKRVKTPSYRSWRKDAEAALVRLKRPEADALALRLVVYGGAGLNPARDLDNFVKAIQDALVSAGVLPGDSIADGLWKVEVEYVPDPMRGRGIACVVVGIAEANRA